MTTNNIWYDWPLILAYHSISQFRQDSLAVNVKEFEKQIRSLHQKGYRSVTLEEYISGDIAKGERIVIITFDDGYVDNYFEAFPILKKYGFVATVFLVSDYVSTDHVYYWDVPKISHHYPAELFQVLNWEQVQEMADYGIEFGSHSCTHPELTNISADLCREEITRSKQDIQNKLQHKVVSFCYPRGKLNVEIMEMVVEADYRCAVVTPSKWGIPLSHSSLRRVGIYNETSSFIFQLKTNSLFRHYYEPLLRIREWI